LCSWKKREKSNLGHALLHPKMNYK
jgi:hypothetical protein